MSINTDIATRLKKIAKYNNLTQKQMGEQLHINNSVINRYMRGKQTPHSEAIIAISKKYGVSTDYLLTGELKSMKENEIESLYVWI